ncbi:MAG: FG-GAP-like repeat-containing protein [Thermoanaerobaculia bacterium]
MIESPRSSRSGTWRAILGCLLVLAQPAAAQPLAPPASDELLREGMDLAREGRLQEAVGRFREHVAASPNDPEGHFLLGRALFEIAKRSQRPSPEALVELERALELDGSRDNIRMLLASAYGSRAPGIYRPKRALALYNELLGRLPGNPEIRLRFARWILYSEVRLERTGLADRVFQDSAWGMDLARSQLELVLEQVAAGSEESRRARVLLGDVQFRSGEWEAALATYGSLVSELASGTANLGPIHNMIGHVQWRKGDFDAAAESFRKAHDLSPALTTLFDIYQAYEALGGFPDDLPEKYRFDWRAENPGSPAPALEFEDIAPRLEINKYAGAGPCGWADYNGDGRWDLLTCGCDTFCTLYRAEGDGFVDATAEAELAGLEPGFGAAWADYDNDGDPDLYLSRNGWNGTAANSLLRNDGDGTFTEVAQAAGVADGGSGFHSTWLDYDRDGWLDLVVSNGVYLDGSTNQLYRNQGDGTFRNVTAAAGLAEPAPFGTIGVAVGDYDDDGWPDIFYHGRMQPNRLYRNGRDGTFTDVATQAGVAGSGRQNGYIALMADLDSDGDLDIFTGSLADWDEVVAGYRNGAAAADSKDIPRLYRNNGDGTFRDDSVASGLGYPLGIMAGAVADLDNDGYLDIYLGTGNPDLRRLEPNIFYHNRHGRTFEDLTRFTGLGALGKGHGITFVDWDEDGDLEMFAELGGFYRGDLSHSAFFLNRAGNRNSWLSIRLIQRERNRDAIGARVTLIAGDWRQTQEVTAGRGFSSTDPPVLHFGLGDRTRIERMEIRWPDGTTESRLGVDANQRIEIARGSSEPDTR